MKTSIVYCIFIAHLVILPVAHVFGASAAFKDHIYNPGQLKPIDSELKVKVGDQAPDFTLPSVTGEKVTLSQYRGKKHVVISYNELPLGVFN